MDLSWWSRTRARTEGRAARAIVRNRFLCDRLAQKRLQPIDGYVIDSELAALLRLDDIMNGSDMTGLTPTQARARVAAEILSVEGPTPRNVETRALMIPGPAGDRPARLYIPKDLADVSTNEPLPGILFVHGGGFMTCDLDTHDGFCRRVAVGARARVIALDYRLAPEHLYPAAVEDTVAAFRWMAANASQLEMDSARLAITGDSAGGNLSAVVARKTRNDEIRPLFHAPLYPAVDTRRGQPSHKLFGEGFFLTSNMIDWYYDNYVPDLTRRLEEDCAPLLAKDSLKGIPPALIYSAGFDPLRDEAADYAARLKADGVAHRYVCFDTLVHGFIFMTGVCTGALEASERIARDLGDALYGRMVF